MKTTITTLALGILFSGSTCNKNDENCHKTITFENHTNKALYVRGSRDYPDTLAIVTDANPLLDTNYSKVEANENNNQVLRIRDCYEYWYKDILPSDTLMVYVFDADVLETTPWETVISDNLILKRYDLSLEDLQNSDWTISYP